MKLGLIGEKLGHSLSPEIHQKIFEKLCIRGTYNLLPIARMNLKDTVETLQSCLRRRHRLRRRPYRELLDRRHH